MTLGHGHSDTVEPCDLDVSHKINSSRSRISQRHHVHQIGDDDDDNNNNDNNNTHNNVNSAVIMTTRSLREFTRFI